MLVYLIKDPFIYFHLNLFLIFFHGIFTNAKYNNFVVGKYGR